MQTDFWLQKVPELYVKTLEHLMLTGISTGIAVFIGLPLGIWITRQERLKGIVLGTAGILQTIPSLAMLAFLLPLLGIGVRPALVALILYAILPIIRNTYTGLREISPEILEAAQGMGFSSAQRLWIVELPLALPMIVAGIRTATVIGVGIATLSAFIGAGGLGDFINRGLALNNTRLILLGAVPAAVLALLLDFSIGLIEACLRPGRLSPLDKKRMALFSGGILAFVIIGAGFYYLAFPPGNGLSKKAYVRIGSKNFTEQLILGELFAQQIEKHTDIEVERKFNLGGTILCHRALVNGEIDLYPEYTGTALTAILELEKGIDPEDQFMIISKAYRQRFNCRWLSPLGFNNTYAITVRGKDAAAKGWNRISHLVRDAPSLRGGFTAEFSERPDGYPGLQEAYGLSFGKVFDLDPGLMYNAIAQGEVDVVCAFSTDGRIDAYNLLTLQDDLHFFPPYFAAPVVRIPTLENYPELAQALHLLAGTITDNQMRQLNYQVDEKGLSPAEVVRNLLNSSY